LLGAASSARAAGKVEIRAGQLLIDGQKQPQLFGAELQYFRLRGGYERNVPRERVIALWNKALDRMVEARMNAISFYIPWDFHEYAEGEFDFTGTVDEDGDGRPDYPSRDLVTFFKLIADHGIRHILVRPGPYINAEWGFLGFGAIPPWFHEKYPASHMMHQTGIRSALFDYLNPDFLRHTRLWFEALYERVLREQMGPGKPVDFLQVDNETNYQWQSLKDADFSSASVARYQRFLRQSYGSLEALNRAHGRGWQAWSQIQPPREARQNIPEDQDWYRFNDRIIYEYLGRIRRLWERIGVREPSVLFTLAESYNAPEGGLLPNYVYKNSPGHTGLMTVNLYPKTSETPDKVLLNSPFKADLDVKSATEAGSAYFGAAGGEWAMGPEIQAGWWRGVPVTDEARQQTYLTILGHGLKSFFVYYFNEGPNWNVEWGFERIKPIFAQLREERNLGSTPVRQLPDDFWGELQARSDRELVKGFNARSLMEEGRPGSPQELFFDSPLDPNAEPRAHFDRLKLIGERVVAPYQDFLARALEAVDPVAVVKDSASHAPSPVPSLDAGRVLSDWNGALLGYLMNAGVNPRVLQSEISPKAYFEEAKLLVHLDTGLNAQRTLDQLKTALKKEHTVLNFLGNEVPEALGMPVPRILENGVPVSSPQALVFYVIGNGQLGSGVEPDSKAVQVFTNGPVFTYDLAGRKDCQGILFWQGKTAGYRCGRNFVQAGALFFEDTNSNDYAKIPNGHDRGLFVQALLKASGVRSLLSLSENAERTVAFARKDPLRKLLWITVKTGSRTAQSLKLRLSPELLGNLPERERFRVTDLLAQGPGAPQQVLGRKQLIQEGFSLELLPDGSGVFVVEPANQN
jgi:hypothetical protein